MSAAVHASAARDLCGVLLNARARGVARDRALLGAVRTLVGGDGRVEVTDDLAQLPGAAERVLAGAPRVVALAGGDGTLSCGLAALESASARLGLPLPPLLILSAGTMTTIVRGLGEARPPLEALAAALRDLREGLPLRVEHVPFLRANGAPGFLVGSVVVARLIDLYERGGAAGPAGAWRVLPGVVARALLGGGGGQGLFAPEPVRLTVDGMRLPQARVRVLLAGTVADVGIGMKFLYRARERAGLFHLVALDASPPLLARRFPRAFLGRPWHLPDSFDGLAARAEVEFAAEQPYIHDGELRRARVLNIEHGGELALIR